MDDRLTIQPKDSNEPMVSSRKAPSATCHPLYTVLDTSSCSIIAPPTVNSRYPPHCCRRHAGSDASLRLCIASHRARACRVDTMSSQCTGCGRNAPSRTAPEHLTHFTRWRPPCNSPTAGGTTCWVIASWRSAPRESAARSSRRERAATSRRFFPRPQRARHGGFDRTATGHTQ